jgi:starch phosphorylase
MRRIDERSEHVLSGDSLPIKIGVNLAGLKPEDVIVECVVGRERKADEFVPHEHFLLEPMGETDQRETLFGLDLQPSLPGQLYYKLRMYPSHRLLANRFETGLMIWL